MLELRGPTRMEVVQKTLFTVNVTIHKYDANTPFYSAQHCLFVMQSFSPAQLDYWKQNIQPS